MRSLAAIGVALVLALAGCSGSRPGVASGGPGGGAGVVIPPSVTPTPSVPATTPSPAAARRYVFPVAGNNAYTTTHHDYPATDIIAPCGSPIRAITDGTVLEVNRVDRWRAATDDGAWRGGMFVALLGADGVRYYGAHMSSIAPGLAPGQRVSAGQMIGEVGRTGKAGACHLHLGISPPCKRAGDWWVRRGAVWPSKYLDAWRAGRSLSPAAEVAAWQRSNGCPASPPPGA